MRIFSKIGIVDIVVDHYGTLRNYETGRLMPTDWLLFLGVPALLGAAIVATSTHVSDLGTLLTAVSIVAGLLFALLILVLEIAINTAERSEEQGGTPRRRRRVATLRELKANVAYAVLVAVLAAIALAIGDMSGPAIVTTTRQSGSVVTVEQFPVWFTAIVAVLLAHFALTLLMVLKRMYRLLDGELDKIESEPIRKRA